MPGLYRFAGGDGGQRTAVDRGVAVRTNRSCVRLEGVPVRLLRDGTRRYLSRPAMIAGAAAPMALGIIGLAVT
jgi:hypothetical protein